MIYDKEEVLYSLKGLNFNKFLIALKNNNIPLIYLLKKDKNIYELKVLKKDEIKFIDIVKNFNFEIKKIDYSLLLKMIIYLKKNIIMFILSFILLFSILICNNFVFRIEINGNKNISVEKIENVLKLNGFGLGKMKNDYNLDNIEIILKNNIDEISLASAIFVGNTLIINIKEKIVN